MVVINSYQRKVGIPVLFRFLLQARNSGAATDIAQIRMRLFVEKSVPIVNSGMPIATTAKKVYLGPPKIAATLAHDQSVKGRLLGYDQAILVQCAS